MHLDTLTATAGDVTDPTPDSLAAGRHQLDRAIDGAGARVAAVRRSRRPRRWGITALVGAAAAVVAVIAVPLVSATPASAEAVLLAAAEAAGQQVDEAADAAYWHVASEFERPGAAPFRRDVWMGRSEESVLREQHPAEDTATDGATTQATDRTETFGGPVLVYVGEVALTWEELTSLPTDADELEARLRDMVGGHDSGEEKALWEGIVSLLWETPASPELRRALWQVAAGVPGVELLGTATDSAGREGTAVERDQLEEGSFREIYILDPDDGTLLETQSMDAAGTVMFRGTVLEQGPADSAPAPQPPICGPGSESGLGC